MWGQPPRLSAERSEALCLYNLSFATRVPA
jgi:hypothetical protein